ncbi:hypothetical protein [Nocardia asiatica]|uniref:hypothetical protein n=1 Tax=Nocardia asiatica TaxID=209252 RepID=UPI002455161F|nr:hypothetical protein [Nocardia asiatica]
MKPSEVNELEQALTENALAFLRRSVEGMGGSPDTRDAEFAIVDLAVGVEVLLKARVLRHDWKLICVDRDKKPEEQLERELLAGTAYTITPSSAVKVLTEEVGVDFEANEYHGRVEQVSKLRNRAVHFTLSQGPLPISVTVAYGRGLDFVLWFLDSEFRDSTPGRTANLVEEFIKDLTEVVGEIKEFVVEREKSVAASIRAIETCLTCPRCERRAVSFTESDRVRCVFCLWNSADGEVAAAEYVSEVLGMDHYTTVKGGDEWPIHECVNCGEMAMVQGIEDSGEHPGDAGSLNCDGYIAPYWGCFSCGMTAGYVEIDRCSRCDRPTTEGGDDGTPICSECWAEVLESD